MDEVVLRAAVAALVDGRRHPIADAVEIVPDLAGLYAVYGDGEARNTLALGSSDVPLYVGKAERSLASRDVHTHFATGRTGSSTLRRSMAALLRSELDLHAVPRNLARPDCSANLLTGAGWRSTLDALDASASAACILGEARWCGARSR
jgi:hypothetical protein